MKRKTAITIAIVGGTAFMLSALFWPARRGSSGNDPDFTRWHALPEIQRKAHVRIWNDTQRRADATTVLKRAAAFTELNAPQKSALRRLRDVQEAALRAAPAARRAYLLGLPAAARAVELARLLEQSNPEAVAEIRSLFGASRGTITDRPPP